jgi:hypothetical protein
MNQIPQPAPPAKGKSKMLIVGIVAVAAILIVVMIIFLTAPKALSGGGADTHTPAANIQYVRSTFGQALLSGDTTVSATFTNTGDAIGGKYANVRVTLGSATYSAQKWITLAPGETQTFDIVVDTPFGKTVYSSNIDIWLA